MPDCSHCHTAVDPAPSLAQLLPGGRVALAVTLVDEHGAALGDEDTGTWADALVTTLHDEGVSVVDVTDGAAPTLAVELRRLEGPGRTDAGTTFMAVRYDAVLRIGRAEVAVHGAPFVDASSAPRGRARDELIARIVPIIAY